MGLFHVVCERDVLSVVRKYRLLSRHGRKQCTYDPAAYSVLCFFCFGLAASSSSSQWARPTTVRNCRSPMSPSPGTTTPFSLYTSSIAQQWMFTSGCFSSKTSKPFLHANTLITLIFLQPYLDFKIPSFCLRYRPGFFTAHFFVFVSLCSLSILYFFLLTCACLTNSELVIIII